MKKFLKYTVLMVQILLVAQLSSCKKDDPGKKDCCSQKGKVVYLPVGCVGNSTVLGILDDKGNYLYVKSDPSGKFQNYQENDEICFDFEETSPCNIVLPMGIMKVPLKCVKLTCVGHCKDVEEDCLTVDYIPSQCANTHSGVLGLRTGNGKYLMVKEDKTGSFRNYTRGDKIKVSYKKVGSCIVCMACHCPGPDACIEISRISPCTPMNICKKPTELSYLSFRNFKELQHHTVRDLRVVNGKLKMKVSVSGCDANFSPDLYLSIPPLGAPFSVINGKLKFNRMPQTCKALFWKEMCYDIRPWLNAGHKSISVQSGTEWVSVYL